MADEPKDSRVLYTNDVVRLVAAYVSVLFTVAEPEQIRKALRDILENWSALETKSFRVTAASPACVATADPEDSPPIRQVLRAGDVQRMLEAYLLGLFTVAEPERVKVVLEEKLKAWDEGVQMAARIFGMAEVFEQRHRQSVKGKN